MRWFGPFCLVPLVPITVLLSSRLFRRLRVLRFFLDRVAPRGAAFLFSRITFAKLLFFPFASAGFSSRCDSISSKLSCLCHASWDAIPLVLSPFAPRHYLSLLSSPYFPGYFFIVPRFVKQYSSLHGHYFATHIVLPRCVAQFLFPILSSQLPGLSWLCRASWHFTLRFI